MEGALAGRPWDVLVLGSVVEGMTVPEQNLPTDRKWVRAFGNLDWAAMAAIMLRVPATLGYEGDWVHLACALGRPHVVLAGGGTFKGEAPYSPLTTLACRPLACYGCGWKCRYPSLHCLEELRPAAAGAALAHALGRPGSLPHLVLDEAARTGPGAPAPVALSDSLDATQATWATLQG